MWSAPALARPAGQRHGASCRGSHARRAIVIEEIVNAAPDNVESIRVNRMGGEVSVHLPAHVVDRDRDVAENRRRDDHFFVRAIFCAGATKGMVGAAAETMSRHRDLEESTRELFVPDAGIGGRRRIVSCCW